MLDQLSVVLLHGVVALLALLGGVLALGDEVPDDAHVVPLVTLGRDVRTEGVPGEGRLARCEVGPVVTDDGLDVLPVAHDGGGAGRGVGLVVSDRHGVEGGVDGLHRLDGVGLGEAGGACDGHEPLAVGVGVDDGLAGAVHGRVAAEGRARGLGLEVVDHLEQGDVDILALLRLVLAFGGGDVGVDVSGEGGLLLDGRSLLGADALDLSKARRDGGLLACLIGTRRGDAAGLLDRVDRSGSRCSQDREGLGIEVVLLHRGSLHVHWGHDDGVASGVRGEDAAGTEGREVA